MASFWLFSARNRELVSICAEIHRFGDKEFYESTIFKPRLTRAIYSTKLSNLHSAILAEIGLLEESVKSYKQIIALHHDRRAMLSKLEERKALGFVSENLQIIVDLYLCREEKTASAVRILIELERGRDRVEERLRFFHRQRELSYMTAEFLRKTLSDGDEEEAFYRSRD